jgi:uncharacterized membrane protein YbhN (UPF0104 family)
VTEPRPDQRARYGSAALATAVTVAFGYLAVRNVDIDELGESLRESNYWFLLPAFGLLVLAFFLRVLRWRCLFGIWGRAQFTQCSSPGGTSSPESGSTAGSLRSRRLDLA